MAEQDDLDDCCIIDIISTKKKLVIDIESDEERLEGCAGILSEKGGKLAENSHYGCLQPLPPQKGKALHKPTPKNLPFVESYKKFTTEKTDTTSYSFEETQDTVMNIQTGRLDDSSLLGKRVKAAKSDPRRRLFGDHA